MEFLKTNAIRILTCLLEAFVGIVLLINPAGFTESVIIGTGIILLATGVVSILRYFRTNPQAAADGRFMARGLIMLWLGGFCAFEPEWFLETFPIFTIVYGVGTLLIGLGKVRWMMDAIRLKKGKWFLIAISALLSVICGIIMIRKPFHSTELLWLFSGISLIVEAVIDMVALVFVKKESEENVERDNAPEPSGTM